MKRRMSFLHSDIPSLWQTFMPLKKEIQPIKSTFLFSLEVYDDISYFEQFDAGKEFDKWAAVEVEEHTKLPEGMQKLVIPEGTYAVFVYKGLPKEAFKFYQSIYNEWLPASGYQIDHRPHFALMGDKYKKDDPDSEEEIYIPIKLGI